MRSRAGEYDAEASKVGETISKMDQLLSALESEWEGAAARAYSARFEQLRPSFVQAQQLIEEIAAALRKTAITLEETDQAIAAGM